MRTNLLFQFLSRPKLHWPHIKNSVFILLLSRSKLDRSINLQSNNYTTSKIRPACLGYWHQHTISIKKNRQRLPAKPYKLPVELRVGTPQWNTGQTTTQAFSLFSCDDQTKENSSVEFVQKVVGTNLPVKLMYKVQGQ